MFVLSKQGNAVFRAVAMLVTLALVLWIVGVHSQVEAANITSVSNTLTDSDLGVVSNHTITFTTPTGVLNGETIVVTFPNGFNISTSSVDSTDIDVATTSDFSVAADCTGAEEVGASISGQDLTLTFCAGDGGSVPANGTTTIEIGTNATFGTTGDQQVTNHGTAGSYEFNITAGGSDSGSTRVVVIDNVLVTASVDTVFDFTITGFSSSGTDANGTTTTGTSTATAIPFGTLSAGVVETIAQRLNVTSNAIGGFVVTVEQDQNLLSSTGADIDGFADGAYTDTPSDWAAPTNTISDEDTWGHWGLTSTDDINASEFQGCAGAATGCWIAASTTPRAVFSHTGPADGTTVDIGSTTVAYQIEITPLQEAADDYETTLTYIATPTF